MNDVIKKHETPILMMDIMVQATRQGRKTQTRRLFKKTPSETWTPHSFGEVHKLVNGEPDPSKVIGHGFSNEDGTEAYVCPYGNIGDHIWVKETWSTHADFDHLAPKNITARSIHYWADGKIETGKKRPSLFMPRWASRILLEIQNIRVQRLNDISGSDAKKEGLYQLPATGRFVVRQGDQYFGGASSNPVEVFKLLWSEINGEDAWDLNPWVWVIEFSVIKGSVI